MANQLPENNQRPEQKNMLSYLTAPFISMWNTMGQFFGTRRHADLAEGPFNFDEAQVLDDEGNLPDEAMGEVELNANVIDQVEEAATERRADIVAAPEGDASIGNTTANVENVLPHGSEYDIDDEGNEPPSKKPRLISEEDESAVKIWIDNMPCTSKQINTQSSEQDEVEFVESTEEIGDPHIVQNTAETVVTATKEDPTAISAYNTILEDVASTSKTPMSLSEELPQLGADWIIRHQGSSKQAASQSPEGARAEDFGNIEGHGEMGNAPNPGESSIPISNKEIASASNVIYGRKRERSAGDENYVIRNDDEHQSKKQNVVSHMAEVIAACFEHLTTPDDQDNVSTSEEAGAEDRESVASTTSTNTVAKSSSAEDLFHDPEVDPSDTETDREN